MTKILVRCIAALTLIGLLASCGSEQDEDQVQVSRLLLGSVVDIVTSRRESAPQKTVVTPEMLAQTKVAALQVNPEITGGSDFLRRVAARNDSYPGRVEIWKSSDNAQVFLRNGVVVGTRGVGRDIIASDSTVTVAAVANRRDGSGLRSFEISDGDVTTTKVEFHCEIDVVGPEQILIVNQRFATTRMREDCTESSTGGWGFQNDYWIQNGTGLVRQSRQWVGPLSGYFEIILLKN